MATPLNRLGDQLAASAAAVEARPKPHAARSRARRPHISRSATNSTTASPTQAIQRCRSSSPATTRAATPISTTDIVRPTTSTQGCCNDAPATASTLSRLMDRSASTICTSACRIVFTGTASAAPCRTASDRRSSRNIRQHNPQQQQPASEQQPDDGQQLHRDQREADPHHRRSTDAQQDGAILLRLRQPRHRHAHHDGVVPGQHQVNQQDLAQGDQFGQKVFQGQGSQSLVSRTRQAHSPHTTTRHEAPDGSALQPPRHDRDLGAREPLPHLVRDRGTGLRGHGRHRRHPRRRRPHHPGTRRCQGRRHHPIRPGPHRRHRERDPARRHRLPDLACGGHRHRQPLRPPGPDQQRRAGHLPVGADDPGSRPAAGRPGWGAGRAQAPGHGVQAHPHHRPQPRHPCGAHRASA